MHVLDEPLNRLHYSNRSGSFPRTRLAVLVIIFGLFLNIRLSVVEPPDAAGDEKPRVFAVAFDGILSWLTEVFLQNLLQVAGLAFRQPVSHRKAHSYGDR